MATKSAKTITKTASEAKPKSQDGFRGEGRTEGSSKGRAKSSCKGGTEGSSKGRAKSSCKGGTEAAVKAVAKAEPKAAVKAEPKAAAKAESKKVSKTAAKKAPKKTTVKKATAKKAETKIYVQYMGQEFDQQEIVERIITKYMQESGRARSSIKSLDVYIKPEDQTAYYVLNGQDSSISL